MWRLNKLPTVQRRRLMQCFRNDVLPGVLTRREQALQVVRLW